jgi:phosphoglycolate phosphatase
LHDRVHARYRKPVMKDASLSLGTKVNAIVLDFDGTIADTRSLILSCFRAAYERLGLDTPSDRRIASTIGLPLERAFRELSGLSEDEGTRAAEVYRTVFRSLGAARVEAIVGMPAVVTRCAEAGYRLAVASSRGHESLQALLPALGLSEYLEVVAGREDAAREKPDPALLFRVAEALGLPPAELLMVGDTRFDLEMGRAAGSATVGVTWGNHSRTELESAGPTAIIDDPAELLALLGL